VYKAIIAQPKREYICKEGTRQKKMLRFSPERSAELEKKIRAYGYMFTGANVDGIFKEEKIVRLTA